MTFSLISFTCAQILNFIHNILFSRKFDVHDDFNRFILQYHLFIRYFLLFSFNFALSVWIVDILRRGLSDCVMLLLAATQIAKEVVAFSTFTSSLIFYSAKRLQKRAFNAENKQNDFSVNLLSNIWLFGWASESMNY